ncbi:MAG: 2Fe-2S iron-sulfur cluster binding protein [Ferruginibacter sp.]|nr:2Fe-2S iron-sulfur cluster binding protein [Ferruginibacter sp.]
MNSEKNTIIFTLVYLGKEYPVHTYRNEYHSLMVLIADYLSLPGFGLCSGMGSCGTCMVEIKENYSPYTRHTLSCDVRVNDELANTIITIAEANY